MWCGRSSPNNNLFGGKFVSSPNRTSGRISPKPPYPLGTFDLKFKYLYNRQTVFVQEHRMLTHILPTLVILPGWDRVCGVDCERNHCSGVILIGLNKRQSLPEGRNWSLQSSCKIQCLNCLIAMAMADGKATSELAVSYKDVEVGWLCS